MGSQGNGPRLPAWVTLRSAWDKWAGTVKFYSRLARVSSVSPVLTRARSGPLPGDGSPIPRRLSGVSPARLATRAAGASPLRFRGPPSPQAPRAPTAPIRPAPSIVAVDRVPPAFGDALACSRGRASGRTPLRSDAPLRVQAECRGRRSRKSAKNDRTGSGRPGPTALIHVHRCTVSATPARVEGPSPLSLCSSWVPRRHPPRPRGDCTRTCAVARARRGGGFVANPSQPRIDTGASRDRASPSLTGLALAPPSVQARAHGPYLLRSTREVTSWGSRGLSRRPDRSRRS